MLINLYGDILCSVDLKMLVDHNRPNFIPPTSRMTNYVVLRFGSSKPEAIVSPSLSFDSNNSFIRATL